MKNLFCLFLFWAVIFCAKDLHAQEEKDLSKYYGIVSKYIPVQDGDKKDLEKLIYYRFGWGNKAPYTLAVQFANLGYGDHKLKFAIKDVTAKKMIVLDAVHQSRFGTEILKSSSKGLIWYGPIDDINDSFSLHVWDGDDDEVDKEPISIKYKK